LHVKSWLTKLDENSKENPRVLQSEPIPFSLSPTKKSRLHMPAPRPQRGRGLTMFRLFNGYHSYMRSVMAAFLSKDGAAFN